MSPRFEAFLVLAISVGLVGFAVKVENEKQMTTEYHEQALQQKRTADVLEFFAAEKRDPGPIQPGTFDENVALKFFGKAAAAK